MIYYLSVQPKPGFIFYIFRVKGHFIIPTLLYSSRCEYYLLSQTLNDFSHNSLLIVSSSFLPQPLTINILIERFDHHAQFTTPFVDFLHCNCDEQQWKQAKHPAHSERNDFVPLSLSFFRAQVYSTTTTTTNDINEGSFKDRMKPF